MKRAWLVAVVLLAGCGGDQSELSVFAASSLKAPFAQIGQLYEQQNPGTTVAFTFAGSADLVAQVDHGAPASVLATADEATMARATAGSDLSARPFATNTLTVVVPTDNPGNVTQFADLADPDLTVVICAPQVPCGAATVEVERATGVEIAADSEESAVSDVLGKVMSGQADAGIVYATDLTSGGEAVRGIAIPDSVNATNLYLIAPVDDGGAAFADFVLGHQGQQVMARHGFGRP